jgi:hypothetical protein
MGTDEKPSGLSLPSETKTGHGRDYLIYVVVGIRIPKRGEGCLAETNPFCFDRGKKDMVSFYKGLMEKEPSVSIIYKELPRNKFHG